MGSYTLLIQNWELHLGKKKLQLSNVQGDRAEKIQSGTNLGKEFGIWPNI